MQGANRRSAAEPSIDSGPRGMSERRLGMLSVVHSLVLRELPSPAVSVALAALFVFLRVEHHSCVLGR